VIGLIEPTRTDLLIATNPSPILGPHENCAEQREGLCDVELRFRWIVEHRLEAIYDSPFDMLISDAARRTHPLRYPTLLVDEALVIRRPISSGRSSRAIVSTSGSSGMDQIRVRR
jgi:hypothetical protein